MDGTGRWIDNVLVERLWRSVKYEDLYLHAYRDGARHDSGSPITARSTMGDAGHQSLDYPTPDEVYFGARAGELATAA